MRDRKKSAVAAIVLALLAAVTIGGLVWTITQAVRSSGYIRAVATVTACETQDFDGEQVNVRVLVEYTDADGVRRTDASYIGDLNRCSVGLTMNVYYPKDGDRGYVYSKPSDLGFALIMLCGGAVWLAVAAGVVVCLNRSGYFMASPQPEKYESDD